MPDAISGNVFWGGTTLKYFVFIRLDDRTVLCHWQTHGEGRDQKTRSAKKETIGGR
jgi:hypothetical protein